jgi:hypothetical protein
LRLPGKLLENTFPYPPPQIAAHGLRRLTANQSKATFATQHCQLFKELSPFECFCGLIQQPTICRCFRSRSFGPFRLETLGQASRQNSPSGLLFSDLLRVSNGVSQI